MGIRQLTERIVGGSSEGPVDFHYKKWYLLTMATIQYPRRHDALQESCTLKIK